MALYDDLFGQFGQPVAQLLLTKNDLADVSLVICDTKSENQNSLTNNYPLSFSVHNI